MAEHSFQEVMRQLNRMCKAHPKCEGEGNDCPLHELGCCGNIGTYCSEPLQVDRIEKTVMRWALENPEPVYETWLEFIKRYETGKPKSDNDFIYWMGTTPIPADIAQKLGIEPKEG